MGELALLSARPTSDLPGSEPLADPLAADTLALLPLAEAHRAALRTACGEDAAIWPIYARSWDPRHFDASFDAALADPTRHGLAVMDDGVLMGMTAWLDLDRTRQTVEIGSTYLRPAARGTGLNARMKRLMLDHAFAHDIRRVIFTVDTRNARSQAAMAKLGAVREGVLRQHLVTWTGHVRDSALFSILKDEWR